jgi:hypothetical protein
VVAGEDGPAGGGDVLGALDVDLHVQHAEHRLGSADDGGIHELHAMTVRAEAEPCLR